MNNATTEERMALAMSELSKQTKPNIIEALKKHEVNCTTLSPLRPVSTVQFTDAFTNAFTAEEKERHSPNIPITYPSQIAVRAQPDRACHDRREK